MKDMTSQNISECPLKGSKEPFIFPPLDMRPCEKPLYIQGMGKVY